MAPRKKYNRPKRPCPHCGRSIASNNMSTHIKMHEKNGTATDGARVKDASKADGTYTFVCSEGDYKTNGPRGWAAHKRDVHPDATNVATEHNKQVRAAVASHAETAPKNPRRTASTNGHKKGNVKLSDEETAIGHYLDALASHGGDDRPRSYFEKKMEKAQIVFVRSHGVKRALVAQEITEIQRELDRRPVTTDLEDVFIKHGLVFCGTHNIEYGTLRVLGVPVRVLKAAGIER